MQVTFIPNSGEPVEVFESEDCDESYQEYLAMHFTYGLKPLPETQAEDQSLST